MQSDRYVDKTDCFESFFYPNHHTLQYCKGTGSSLFLKTLACFLDASIDSKEVFRDLKIGKNVDVFKQINSYRVVWLDFSDFDANCFQDAIEYIKDKMSDIYKDYYFDFGLENGKYYDYRTDEFALEIIGRQASVTELQNSFGWLLLQLRRYEGCCKETKIAILIDNLVQLEYIASAKGFADEMAEFLSHFLVEDIYRYCDFFLQIGDYCKETESWMYRNHCLSYLFPCAPCFDLKRDYNKLTIDRVIQYRFEIQPFVQCKFDWKVFIAEERERIRQAKVKEEQAYFEFVQGEKKRYAEELSVVIPKVSPNMGIRKKSVNKLSPVYVELNKMLQCIYMTFYPEFNPDKIYRYLLDIDYKKYVVRHPEELEDILKGISKSKSGWGKADVNASGGCWVQVLYSTSDDAYGFEASPETLKVYACLKNKEDIQEVFVDSLNYMLENADRSFGAKIAIVKRSDQMCYWVSSSDFKHLETFYKPFHKYLVKSLPFVAYNGKLGISRDFPGFDGSHNALLAPIISDYSKGIDQQEDVDLE